MYVHIVKKTNFHLSPKDKKMNIKELFDTPKSQSIYLWYKPFPYAVTYKPLPLRENRILTPMGHFTKLVKGQCTELIVEDTVTILVTLTKKLTDLGYPIFGYNGELPKLKPLNHSTTSTTYPNLNLNPSPEIKSQANRNLLTLGNDPTISVQIDQWDILLPPPPEVDVVSTLLRDTLKKVEQAEQNRNYCNNYRKSGNKYLN